MTGFRFNPAWMVYAAATLGIAGVVHITTVLAIPGRAKDDAFTRLARITPQNTMTVLDSRPNSAAALPFMDPAMMTAVCPYDLGLAPLRIAIEPFDQGFIAIGVHGRYGLAFYGLTVQASERSAISMDLMTPAQKQAAEEADSDDDVVRPLRITPSEVTGFVTVDTPLSESGNAAMSQETLSHVRCMAAPVSAAP